MTHLSRSRYFSKPMPPAPSLRLCLILALLLGLAGCQSTSLRDRDGTFSLKRERTAETLVRLTCELNLQRADDDGIYWNLIVPYGPDRRLSLFLSGENAALLLQKQTGGPVEVSFWYHEERVSNPKLVFARGELVTVRDQNGPILDLTVCEVHGDAMTRKAVPISYGLPMREFAEALAGFPHAPLMLGGCVVMHDDPKEAPAYVCPSCEKALADWAPKMTID